MRRKKWPHQTASPPHSTHRREKEGKHFQSLSQGPETGHNPASMEWPGQLYWVGVELPTEPVLQAAHSLHVLSPTKKQTRTLRASCSPRASLGVTTLPMPPVSACHHLHYPPSRNRVRHGNSLRGTAGTAQVEKEKSAACWPEAGNF